MQTFDGFPPGKAKMTKIPAQFFSDLLPKIDHLAELKVTLFCLWALQQQEGDYRYLRQTDFVNNAGLMASLKVVNTDQTPEAHLRDGLLRAVERGTLLRVIVALDSGDEILYFVNTARGRHAVARIKAGDWQPGTESEPVMILPERPNSYMLYETNIGPLTPLIADEIKDAERDYPPEWIQDAIKQAVESNARNWRYIRAILERWQTEGRSREVTGRSDERDRARYVKGKYADFIDS